MLSTGAQNMKSFYILNDWGFFFFGERTYVRTFRCYSLALCPQIPKLGVLAKFHLKRAL